ncbi:all trans-polyprenyl-diphosphate synthase PDSS2-like [Styela clava]
MNSFFKLGRRLTNCSREISVFSTSQPNGTNHAWHKAVSEAEKIVGFPTSFLSLRALLSDEFGGLALHLRKLISTKHPLLNTARGIMFDSKNYLQTRGLVVLLISKAAGITDIESDFTSTEIYEKQRALAEVTELIHVAFLVHRGIVDVNQIVGNVSKTDIDFGNKLAVLGGDFLLANACTGLAKLQNTQVVDLMSTSIKDISSSLVILPESDSVCDVEMLSGLPMNENSWKETVHLSAGSLLSNACRSAMLLASSDVKLLESAEKFAHHLVLAQQARHDSLRFDTLEALEQKPNFCCLCSLPVVLLAEQNGGLEWIKKFTIDEGLKNVKIDVEKLFHTVKNDPNALQQSHKLCANHVDKALNYLHVFPQSESKDALVNILFSVKE